MFVTTSMAGLLAGCQTDPVEDSATPTDHRDMHAWIERRPLDEPLCDVDNMGDFCDCFAESCSDVTSEGVEFCAGLFCAEEAGDIEPLCESCVAGQLEVTDPMDALDTCISPRDYATPDQPDEECFFQAPGYDFSWQCLYTYDAENNDTLVDALSSLGMDAPIDIYLGDTTLDEMCLLVLQTLYRPN